MNQSQRNKFNPAFSKAIIEADKILLKWEDGCDCDAAEMIPSNTANREVGNYFERLCLKCDRWISYRQMDHYNQYFGYSGYDEVGDEA